MITTQDIFDRVAKHMLNQGEKSTHPMHTEMCAYRGEDGFKCAVGALIADKFYDECLEQQMIGDSDEVQRAVIDSLREEDPEFALDMRASEMLVDLQQVHDNYEPHLWRNRLRLVADSFGLEYRGADYVVG